MALKKEFETKAGVTGEYWKVTELTLRGEKSWCGLSLFRNEAARRAGKEPLAQRNFSWEGAHTTARMDQANPIAIAYGEIRKHVDFADAEDA